MKLINKVLEFFGIKKKRKTRKILKKFPSLTDEQVQKIISLKQMKFSGKTISQIAQTSPATVSRVCSFYLRRENGN